MTEQYAGIITELGGEELGKSGNAKPRKVVIKADPTSQYGKTFRVWQDSNEWQQLSQLNGKHVVVIYIEEERSGGPSGTYKQNMIVGVDAPDSVDGAGIGPSTDSGGGSPPPNAATSAPSTDHSVWGASPKAWGSSAVETVADPTAAAKDAWTKHTSKPTSKDDYWERKEAKDEDRSNQMAAAWSVGQAISLLSVGADQPPSDEAIYNAAHRLAIVKERIAKELAE